MLYEVITLAGCFGLLRARLISAGLNLGLELVADAFGTFTTANPSHVEVGGFQLFIRNDVGANLMALLEVQYGFALLIQQVGRHVNRHLAPNASIASRNVILSRITSYNVCYTKLLRSGQR